MGKPFCTHLILETAIVIIDKLPIRKDSKSSKNHVKSLNKVLYSVIIVSVSLSSLKTIMASVVKHS